MTATGVLRLATRGSPLALDQARRVAELIGRVPGAPATEIVVVQTTGDRMANTPIEKMGGQGAFVKEVSAAVAERRADVAVHSAKDVPSDLQPGLVLAAVPERADPRDAMVGRGVDELVPGSTVATGSVRRRAQLAWLRPDLTFTELRGNIARRVARSEKIGAGVLAVAALERLGLMDHASQVLEPELMMPQVGQGAIAVECRESDATTIALLALVDDPDAHSGLVAERAFLSTLGSGCSLPCGALARRADGAGVIALEAVVASRDGHVLLRHAAEGEDPSELGTRVASELLESAGGRSLSDWGEEDFARAPLARPPTNARVAAS